METCDEDGGRRQTMDSQMHSLDDAERHPEDQNLRRAEQGTRPLVEWTTAEVSTLLMNLGSTFEAAVEVVQQFGINGEDLEEYMTDGSVERNPLYLPLKDGGLGLVEVQVRKVRRELAKRGALRRYGHQLPRKSP